MVQVVPCSSGSTWLVLSFLLQDSVAMASVRVFCQKGDMHRVRFRWATTDLHTRILQTRYVGQLLVDCPCIDKPTAVCPGWLHKGSQVTVIIPFGVSEVFFVSAVFWTEEESVGPLLCLSRTSDISDFSFSVIITGCDCSALECESCIKAKEVR